MSQELRGSCLCGRMAYRITGELFMAAYCHCSMCRKAHGSAFRSRALVKAGNFEWLAGRQLLTDYVSSPGVHRTFCGVCGSPLIAYSDERPDLFNLALGTLDDDPGVRPESHWHVASKAPWYEIADDLPRYDEYPPMRQRS